MGRGAGPGRSRSRSGPPATFRDSRSHRGDAGMTMRRPWIVVLSTALIVTLAMGVRQSFGLFMPQMSMALDIGRESFGLAIAIPNLLFGLRSEEHTSELQ